MTTDPTNPGDFAREFREVAHRFAIRRGFAGTPDEIAAAFEDDLRIRAGDESMTSRRPWRRRGLAARCRLQELFGPTSQLTFGFDEPSDDPMIPAELADEAIEQLYGSRHRGRTCPGNPNPFEETSR